MKQRRWEARADSSVSHWTWDRSRGLRVHYRDGMVCKSNWGKLRDFLAAIKDGREFAREVPVIKENES